MAYILLAALAVGLDQYFKLWTVINIPMRGSRPLLPGILGLTYVHNPGASWGILSGRTGFLLAVTAIACLGIFLAILLKKPASPMGRLSLAMVLGGAVGNAVDRLILGYVVDMFQTQFMDFPIFNVADVFIVCGGCLFCLYILLDERRERLEKKRAAEQRMQQRLERALQDAREEREDLDELIREFKEQDNAGSDSGD